MCTPVDSDTMFFCSADIHNPARIALYFDLLSLSLVGSSWILGEQLVVEVRQLWAIKASKLRTKVLAHEVQDLANRLQEWDCCIGKTGH